MNDDWFGKKIKHLRKARGITQEQMADEIRAQFPGVKMSQTTLSSLEMRRSAPRNEIVDMLSQYFQCNPMDFIIFDSISLSATEQLLLTEWRDGNIERCMEIMQLEQRRLELAESIEGLRHEYDQTVERILNEGDS